MALYSHIHRILDYNLFLMGVEMNKYESLVPLDHYCESCGKNKEEVGFTVQHNKHCRTVFRHCNACIHLGLAKCEDSKRRRRRVISVVDNYRDEVRKRIREDIANYFKENY